MYLPLTVKFSDTGEHHGIFNKLTKTYNVDLLGEKYVSLNSTKLYSGDIKTLVNHDTGHCQSESYGEVAFIQVSFLKGYIFPTGYTLKGKTGYFFSKSWYVYGIHEGDENMENRWDILGINDTSQSNYCKALNSYGNCGDERVGSFSLKQMTTIIGYKHLRWKLKEPNPMHDGFMTAGIDVYGTLSLNKIQLNQQVKTFCYGLKPLNYIFVILLLY